VNVRVEGELRSYTPVPLVAPKGMGTQMFVNHPQIADSLRREMAAFLGEQTDLVSLDRAHESALVDDMRSLAATQMSLTRGRLAKVLPRRGAVAMEHQDIGGNPDLSRVDGGTVELVRSYGPRVVSSADVANAFLGPWQESDQSAHARALAFVIAAEDEIAS